jgi:hypothetical protein
LSVYANVLFSPALALNSLNQRVFRAYPTRGPTFSMPNVKDATLKAVLTTVSYALLVQYRWPLPGKIPAAMVSAEAGAAFGQDVPPAEAAILDSWQTALKFP